MTSLTPQRRRPLHRPPSLLPPLPQPLRQTRPLMRRHLPLGRPHRRHHQDSTTDTEEGDSAEMGEDVVGGVGDDGRGRVGGLGFGGE